MLRRRSRRLTTIDEVEEDLVAKVARFTGQLVSEILAAGTGGWCWREGKCVGQWNPSRVEKDTSHVLGPPRSLLASATVGCSDYWCLRCCFMTVLLVAPSRLVVFSRCTVGSSRRCRGGKLQIGSLHEACSCPPHSAKFTPALPPAPSLCACCFFEVLVNVLPGATHLLLTSVVFVFGCGVFFRFFLELFCFLPSRLLP